MGVNSGRWRERIPDPHSRDGSAACGAAVETAASFTVRCIKENWHWFLFFPNMQSCNMQQVSSCSVSSWVGFAVAVWWTGGGWNCYSHPSWWESCSRDLTSTFGSSAAAEVNFKSLEGTLPVGLALSACEAAWQTQLGKFWVSSLIFIIFHIGEIPWYPQIRVGSVGTMEGWPGI